MFFLTCPSFQKIHKCLLLLIIGLTDFHVCVLRWIWAVLFWICYCVLLVTLMRGCKYYLIILWIVFSWNWNLFIVRILGGGHLLWLVWIEQLLVFRPKSSQEQFVGATCVSLWWIWRCHSCGFPTSPWSSHNLSLIRARNLY